MRGRLDSLTGLRFFAALVVVFRHGFSVAGLGGPLGALAAPGYVGVSFFFVLSGFVLMWSWRPGSSWRRFWLHRFARVWPLHALTFLLAFGAVGLATPSWYAWDHDTPAWGAIANALLVQAWVPSDEVQFGLNAPAWSLSTEAFFYLVFPALAVVLAMVRRPRMAAAAVAVGLVTFGVAGASVDAVRPWLYVLPLYRVGEFVIGMLVAVAVIHGWRPRVRLGSAVLFACASYLLVAAAFVDAEPFVATLVMLPSVTLLLATAAAQDLAGGSWLARGPLVRLGQWSFALYLVHYPVLAALQGAGARGVSAMLACLAVSVPLSGVLFTWFERPVERWLRGLPDRRGRVRGAVAEPVRA